MAVSGGWDELERYGGACQLANLPTCRLVGFPICWEVGKLAECGGAGRRGPAQMGRRAQVSTPGRVAGKEGGKRVWWFTGGVNR